MLKQEIKEFFKAIKGDRFFHPFPFTDETIDIILSAKKDIYRFIKEGEKINGEKIIGMFMLRGWDEGYEIPSFGMVVHPEYRGKGLGTFMLRQAVSLCRKMECKKIRLTADKDNKVGIYMYKREGFKFNKNVAFKNL